MDKLFEKYRKRLNVFAVFKSVLLALALALIVVGITSSITWVAKASISVAIPLAFGLGGLAFAVAIFPLYFKHFRPTTMDVAKKLDALGFDERYITMYECQDKTSTMAKLQREDAKNSLCNVPAKCLKFSVAIPLIVMLVFGAIFAAGTTTGTILSAANSSPSINNNTAPPLVEKEYFTITYEVFEKGTGTIEGELVQKVEKGHYTTSVTAISASGYRFSGWVDKDKNFLANQNNPRAEVNVQQNMTIFALFEEKSSSDDDDDNEIADGKGDSNKDPEQGGGEVKPNPDSSQGGGGESSSGGGEGQGSGKNNVIDGTVDYRDNFDRNKLEQELLDKDFPDELKDILGDYYKTLKP